MRESLAGRVRESANVIYCYGNGPSEATKYRISSDPPLNACLARLFGKMDVTCVSGGVRGCLLFVRWWWIESPLFFLLHPGRGPAQSAEREEVKLRGGVCRLRKGGGAGGFETSERRPRKKRVQFWGNSRSRGVLGFRSEKERKSVVKLSAEVAPIGCTRDSCVCIS